MEEATTHLVRLHITVGENLLDNLVLVGRVEFVLELRLAGGAEDTLLAVPVIMKLARVVLFTCITTGTRGWSG
jgi:hypothetical protein